STCCYAAWTTPARNGTCSRHATTCANSISTSESPAWEGFNQQPEALREKGTGQQGHPSAPEPPAISQSRATATRPRSQSAAVEAEHRDSPEFPGHYVPTLLGRSRGGLRPG